MNGNISLALSTLLTWVHEVFQYTSSFFFPKGTHGYNLLACNLCSPDICFRLEAGKYCESCLLNHPTTTVVPTAP